MAPPPSLGEDREFLDGDCWDAVVEGSRFSVASIPKTSARYRHKMEKLHTTMLGRLDVLIYRISSSMKVRICDGVLVLDMLRCFSSGAGQHGVATATVCARFGLQCIIYMGAQDMERQELNVFRMQLLGAEVRPVHSGTATLKDATSEAIRDWVTNVESTHYILGSVAGPHPYPMMVREFHSVIGKETRKQALEKWGGKPDVLVACVGGGSNAIGLFHEFIDDKNVRLIGVEAAGFGLDSGKHAATLSKGEVGVLHGAMSYLLQDDDGQIIEPHSISAGLDYPGVGPEHSFLKDIGRAEYYSITDEEALEAFKRLSRLEGIIPALETSHALAYLEKLCPMLPDGTKVVLNCSGRGDKDVQTAIKQLKL
ncbi:unnamed protein product [Fraxinus pennsylvanica]|uniref:Tryptophan synthase n=1 Tax=Fraxinus pennsylvanica TaxID=56036 RepID=A0AAD2DHR7_9LAMI|nr:unnamed protein product [Fraxinus pennsylvanica]